MTPHFEHLFPTLVSRGKLSASESLIPRLKKDIKEFSTYDKMGIKWSKENYLGGYTSYASLSDLHHRSPAFLDLSARLQPYAMAFAKSLQWDLRGFELEMTACWVNIMPKNTYHTLHLHPHSVLSGTFYVVTPKNSVPLRLEDPRMPFYMNAPVKRQIGNKSNYYFNVEAKAGDFVLFESWLRHEVPPNRSQEPRISVSFNYGLKAKD